MIKGPAAINPFHRALAAVTPGILGYPTSVKAVLPEWEHLAEGRRAIFHLFAQARGLTVFADKAVGGRCPILPMYPEEAAALEATLWVGWEEEWVSHGDARLELIGAAWTFFWGYQTPRQQQLFRADWDDRHHRGGRAAQPHWHFDRELIADVYRRRTQADLGRYELQEKREQAEDEDLVELKGADILQPLSIAGLHLGMGGWTNPGTDHQRWQLVPDTLGNLKLWACSTLGYAKTQFEHLRSGEAVSL